MKNILSTITSLSLFCIIFAPIGVNAQYLQIPTKVTKNTKTINALFEKVKNTKTVPVIVGLDLQIIPEGYLNNHQKELQRDSIQTKQNDLLSNINKFEITVLAKYKFIPFVALRVNENALRYLQQSTLVSSIYEDIMLEPHLGQSRNIVGSNTTDMQNLSGNGQVIAVIDTGVDKNHPFLANKVLSEACYSQPDREDEFSRDENLCGGQTDTTEINSGVPCNLAGCDHGTHVAGIAVGNGQSTATASGIAKDAKLIAIQVFTNKVTIRDKCEELQINDSTNFSEECQEPLTEISAIQASTSDIVKGLERVHELKSTYNIAAANISIGDPAVSMTCDDNPVKPIIDSLKTIGVATIISSGNNNETNKISPPGCISSAVSVGATNDGSTYMNISATPFDGIWSYIPTNPLISPVGTNSANTLDLLAPGAWIKSSIPLSGGVYFENKWGTSMASPHVSGAWAVLKQRFPNATVDEILNALKASGELVTDQRPNALDENNQQRKKPRIDIPAAITYLEQNLPSSTKFDFNGDGKTDASMFRSTENKWYINYINNVTTTTFGNATDKLVPADFSGDGKTDIAVWRESDTNWYYIDSTTNTVTNYPFGASGDIAVTGDFDGDGKADATIYRPSEGTWYVRKPDGNADVTQFGISEDKPVVEDYDGDGKDDVAVYRPSTNIWYVNGSQSGFYSKQWGVSGDITVPGDYTGDGKADLAVWRSSDKNWYIVKSDDATTYQVTFGLSNDIPTPGDYDGDGTLDIAVYRPNDGNWYINGQSPIDYGLSTDTPLPSVYNVNIP